MVNLHNLRAIFTFQPPTPEKVERYNEIRERAFDLARSIVLHCPEGPDREIAVQKVREAVMWANASIATDNAAAS